MQRSIFQTEILDLHSKWLITVMYVAKLEGQQQFEEYYAIACVQKLLDLI